MDLTGRPRFADFESRIERGFSVAGEDGTDAGAWRLVQCVRLKNPPLAALDGHDCFTLAFDTGGRHWPQMLYHFTAADGFEAQLVATPGPGRRMHVTVN